MPFLSNKVAVFICLALCIFIGCKKDGDSEDKGGIYFRCYINGDTLEMKKSQWSLSDYPEWIAAVSYGGVRFRVKNDDCDGAKPCYDFSFIVYNKGKGVHKPDQLILNMPLGPSLPNYYYFEESPGEANMTVTISTYTVGSADKPGRLAGSFKGVVIMSIPDDPTPPVPYQISGEFACPMVPY